MSHNERMKNAMDRGQKEFLDRILDGHPVHIVDSPQLRRQLLKRQLERAREIRQELGGLW